MGKVTGLEVSCIAAFDVGDAPVLLEFVVKLAVSHIDTDGSAGAVLKGAVGKASGGGTDVENGLVFKIEGKGLEVAFEFIASAADETGRLQDGDFEVFMDPFSGFIENLGAVADLAGKEQGSGGRAGGSQFPGNQEFIEADGHGVNYKVRAWMETGLPSHRSCPGSVYMRENGEPGRREKKKSPFLDIRCE